MKCFIPTLLAVLLALSACDSALPSISPTPAPATSTAASKEKKPAPPHASWTDSSSAVATVVVEQYKGHYLVRITPKDKKPHDWVIQVNGNKSYKTGTCNAGHPSATERVDNTYNTTRIVVLVSGMHAYSQEHKDYGGN